MDGARGAVANQAMVDSVTQAIETLGDEEAMAGMRNVLRAMQLEMKGTRYLAASR